MGVSTENRESRGRLMGSAPIRWLTGQPDRMETPDLLHRWEEGLTERLGGICTALHLQRLLEGSLLLKPGLWAFLTLVLLPFLPTMAALCLCAAAMASALLSRSLARTGNGPVRLRENLYSPGLRLAGLMAFIYLAAIPLSVTPDQSLRPGLLMALFVLFVFVPYGAVTDRQGLRRCFAGITLSALAVSLYGLWQWLHPEAYTTGWLDKDMFSAISFRVYSTLQNPNVLGEFFLLTIPFALALALTEKGWPRRLLWAAILVLMTVCAVLTYSRGCYLGLILGLAVFLVLLDRRFLIPIAAFVLISPWIMPHTVMDRLLSVGDLGDTSTDYRFKIWQGVAAMLKDFWYCGVGPGEGAFYSVYPLYSLEAISAPHAHCLYLQLVSDTGIAGLAVFLGFAGSLLRSLLTTARRAENRETRIFAMAGLAAFSGFLLQSFTDYSFYNYRVMLLFFGIAALCLLLRHVDRRPHRETKAPRWRPCPVDLVILVVIAVVAGVLVNGSMQHGAETQITSGQLLEDLRRSARVHSTEEEEEHREAMISYVVAMTGMDPSYCDNYPETGAEIFDFQSKTSVGTLESYHIQKREDGKADITVRLSKYVIISKLSITTPVGYTIRIGNPVYLATADDKYLGSGTIRWISH